MRYYKQISSAYVIAIGENGVGTEIDGAEYNALLDTINKRPTAPEGYGYRLRTDLTWELYELPPVPEEDAEPADYEAALGRLGVET